MFACYPIEFTIPYYWLIVPFTIEVYDQCRWPNYSVDNSEFYPIYIATCPFGIFTTSGTGSGAFFLGCGGFSSEFTQNEKYIVKFTVGEALKTVTLDANKANVVVDGTFVMEKITTKTYRSSFGRPAKYQSQIRDSISWKIHIPYLPEAPFNMTDNFITP